MVHETHRLVDGKGLPVKLGSHLFSLASGVRPSRFFKLLGTGQTLGIHEIQYLQIAL